MTENMERTKKAARSVIWDRVVTTAVLAWACWLITWVAQRMFEDPSALTTLHAVNALALIVGILATVVALWKDVRGK